MSLIELLALPPGLEHDGDQNKEDLQDQAAHRCYEDSYASAA